MTSYDCVDKHLVLGSLFTAVAAIAWGSAWALPAASPDSDWPMWRHDAGHTAVSPHELPPSLHLAWTRQYAPRTPVWDDPLNQDLMPYDAIFEPVAAEGRVFVGFNDSDKVVAFDARSGREQWRFYADGPVRFSPVVFRGKVYFTSDDGCLYCVEASDGRLRWRFRGAPAGNKVIGNRRVISAWPARGGPVERDGTVYFAASIWPFMGTFVYALDAESGAVRWVNDATGSDYVKQPHAAPAFAGVAPQGQLAATASLLLVPGGRSLPAVLDRHTGRLRYFTFGAKGEGGSFVVADEARMFVHTRVRGTTALNLSDGSNARFRVNEPVLAQGVTYAANAPGRSRDGQPAPAVVQAFDSGKRLLWQVEADGTGDLIKAGRRLYAAGETDVVAIEPPEAGGPPRVAWSMGVEGSPQRLLAAGGMLFAVTRDGRIMAFGAEQGEGKNWSDPPRPLAPAGDAAGRAERLLSHTETREGYALWLQADDEPLLEAVLAAGELHVVVVDSDEGRVARLRRRFDAAGWYGSRVAVHAGDPLAFQPPRYMANLIVVGNSLTERLSNPGALATLYESLRPYGGKLWVPAEDADAACQRFARAGLAKARLTQAGRAVLIAREGPLPGAADWTHAYGDIANTVKSNDQRVRLPLGLLWFGGSSNQDVLPRHGHGPCPQVVGGRLFIEGINCLSARDVYTGRVLWRRDFQDLGTFNVYYDGTYADTPLSTAYNQVHIPGANARGTNYVATPEGVYLVLGGRCLLLDATTGRTLREFALPAADGQQLRWGFIGVYEDLLLAGTGLGDYSQRLGYKYTPAKNRGAAWGPDFYGSLGLVAFDRHTGRTLWKIDAAQSFLHNAVVAGGGRIYCIDRLPARVQDHLRRLGQTPPAPRLLALDARNGQIVWQKREKVFGTWLGYSQRHDVLLEAGATATDRSPDETAKGMTALRGADGKPLWEKPDLVYAGPCILHNDVIITNTTAYKVSQGAFRLLDGAPVTIPHPITGEPVVWNFTRTYGCNTCVASEHLLTFRSGAAGFYDLAGFGGTGNFGGFKSGCTSNLIAADGVLNAPDYTRTCTCAYQNQTSLALVHMPENEMWTCDPYGLPKGARTRIRRLGVNFGAPGDRRSDDGVLWIEYPVVGGASPKVPLEVEGRLSWFRHHSLRVSGAGPAWVAASGVEGIEKITVGLTVEETSAPQSPLRVFFGARGKDDAPASKPVQKPPSPQPYTVRLHFLEPDAAVKPAERVFRVVLQGRNVLERLDPIAEAGGPMRPIVRCFSGVLLADKLILELQPLSTRGPVLCGIELVAEE